MPNPTQAVEIVTYRLVAGVTKERYLPAAAQLDAIARAKFPGYLDRRVYHDETTDEWTEVIHWASLEQAHRAMEIAEKSEECLPIFALIDQASVVMRHAHAVALPVLAR